MNDKEFLDFKLAKIASYLTFDGHLSKDLKSFYLSSKSEDLLKDFEECVKSKFGICGRYENGQGYGESRKYWIFHSKTARFLKEIGIPNGNKVLQEFVVPDWVLGNLKNSREYLRTAFDCEG